VFPFQTFNSDENRLNLLPRESPAVLRGGLVGAVYSDKNSRRLDQLSARVLSATDDDTHSHTDISIKQVTHDAASDSHINRVRVFRRIRLDIP